MSKLSPRLKALINAPSAAPHPTPASSRITEVYRAIARDAESMGVGLKPWVTMSSAATFTLNSPESLSVLHSVATEATEPSTEVANPQVYVAELIREVGLKCVSFNGIPRNINCLNAFYASLPSDVASQLATRPTREPTEENLAAIKQRGRGLWNSVYAPFEKKLVDKLATSHPDLPVHILNSHYGPLLSDPAGDRKGLAKTGRVLTSVIAISCLRAQSGVGPQVVSHIYGLRKGIEDGTFKAEGEEAVTGAEWLATDEGSEWILKSVDSISEALGGSNFGKPRTKM